MCRFIKISFITSCFFLISFGAFAKHIKGGEIFYTYLGPSTKPNFDRYQITLRLYISCQSTEGQLENEVSLAVYRNGDDSLIALLVAELSRSSLIHLLSPSPCIVNPSPVCYWIREFSIEEDLAKDPNGYTVIYQRCCRIDNIRNESPNINVGASYFCQIQGTNTIGLSGVNSNPQFGIKDTVLICQNKRFKLDYSATDPDGDSLSYEFSPGYTGGSTNNPVVTKPPPPNTLRTLGYASGYSGINPLGSGVTINRKTGLISGVAPTAGDYVVCVLLKEYRGGLLVTSHRKDFIIHIDDLCDYPSAALNPNYITCNGLDYTFKNEAKASPLVHTYYWDFGVAGSTTDTSTLANPTFTFPDTGIYKVTLYVNKDELCTDYDSTSMSVFPGFFPGFSSLGTCILNPVLFNDTTKTKYGTVSYRSWNFGDLLSNADTSELSNPTWKYSDTGIMHVQFIVANSKGCMDTVAESVHMIDKPPIFFPFRDTLICSIDTLQLHAQGIGNFSWTPTSTLNGNTIADPLVFPKTTTFYTATLDQSGCINHDSIKVRVVDKVTLIPGNDSTICLGDSAILNETGDGLYFKWTPAASLNNPSVPYPFATPTASTLYTVIASIGKCNATASMRITPIPYPGSTAGTDIFICWNDTAQIHATIKGIRFNWLPATDLSDPNSLNPLAYPLQTTTYQLYVYDTIGCPKPGISSIVIEVNPRILTFAGNDTSIVIGQPLQLQAKGATYYSWSPSFALNQNDISNPVALLEKNQTYVLKGYDERGCFAYDTIFIKVFTTAPDIFVPNAFTPGGTSNNIFKPIPVGISKIEYFRVYNRNGMLIYNTTSIGQGWDGNFNGKPQSVGGYVWMVQGTDYTGKLVTRKGSVVLIR